MLDYKFIIKISLSFFKIDISLVIIMNKNVLKFINCQ